MVELLKFIGLKTKLKKDKKIIQIRNNKKKINTLAPYKLVKTMRAGVLVLGSLLTRYKTAKVSSSRLTSMTGITATFGV